VLKALLECRRCEHCIKQFLLEFVLVLGCSETAQARRRTANGPAGTRLRRPDLGEPEVARQEYWRRSITENQQLPKLPRRLDQ
jgi:hypothetical protein